MSTPTATPRTDAALYPMNGVEIVWPDFARTLETELAAAKAEAAHYMSVAQKATDDLTRLRAELKELSQAYELNRVSIDELDADRARAERAEAALTEAIDGVIDGGSIPDALLVVHVPRSPVGYRVGQPVKVILPAIDAAMKEGSK